MNEHPERDVERIGRLPELKIRRSRLAELIEGLSPVQLADLVERLYFGKLPRTHSGTYVDFVAALRLDPGLEYALRRDVYEIMTSKGYKSAPALLEIPPRYHLAQFPIYELEEVPLGMRKWRARSRDKDLISLMCNDRHPDVIGILLENPVVTQANVMHIVTLRPQRAEVIERVLMSPKWTYRQDVLKGIVRNPWTPAGLAVALLPVVDLPTLEDIAIDGTLHHLVNETAQKLIERIKGEHKVN